MTTIKLRQIQISTISGSENNTNVKRVFEDTEEDLSSNPVFIRYVRPCIVEFLGTFFYVFLSILSELVLNESLQLIATAIVQGLSVAVLMTLFGHISGGHFNPVITLGSWIGGGTEFVLGLFYAVCQCFGAFIGALFARIVIRREVYYGINGGITDINLQLSAKGEALILELILTALLILAYLLTVVDTEGQNSQSAAITVGLTVLIGSICSYRISGASLNPAKSLGAAAVWAIFGELPNWEYHYIYWSGPPIGAIVGAAIYRIVLANEKYRILFQR